MPLLGISMISNCFLTACIKPILYCSSLSVSYSVLVDRDESAGSSPGYGE